MSSEKDPSSNGFPVTRNPDPLYAIMDEGEFYSRKIVVGTKPVKEEKFMELHIDEEQVVVEQEKVEDTKKFAVKLAFLGAGGGGGALADAFYSHGYKRVAIVNTTARDMQRLSVPETNRHILKSPGGAGKDPSIGKQLIEAESEEIFRLCQSAFKGDVEQILICAGGGGGTGTGAALPLVKICQNYLTSIGVKDVQKRVGVVLTLPTKDESSAVQKNCMEALMPLLSMAEEGQLSPLVIIDNARVMQLYGKASVTDVWGKANKNIAALFSSFNELCAIDDATAIQVCDPQDFKTVLQGGILAFGRTKIEKVEKISDVADAVRENVKKGLLVEGLDLSKANCGTAILAGSQENLGGVSQEALEAAFGSLNRLMKQSGETKLHRGIYSVENLPVYMFTMLAGLGRPLARLQEIQQKAGG